MIIIVIRIRSGSRPWLGNGLIVSSRRSNHGSSRSGRRAIVVVDGIGHGRGCGSRNGSRREPRNGRRIVGGGRVEEVANSGTVAANSGNVAANSGDVGIIVVGAVGEVGAVASHVSNHWSANHIAGASLHHHHPHSRYSQRQQQQSDHTSFQGVSAARS